MAGEKASKNSIFILTISKDNLFYSFQLLIFWVWVVGVGTVVEVDDRGRVTIPAEIRRLLKTRKFLISFREGVIELKPVYDEKLEALRAFNEIKLIGDPRFAHIDAAKAKHRVGGKKR
ncbi:MAG: hypothetical protein DRJ60_05765 [Thermoprotei archaeon]|nr:MAG: hypothetical protein DRJ60_05765 [Thermoprotei archaeon]